MIERNIIYLITSIFKILIIKFLRFFNFIKLRPVFAHIEIKIRKEDEEKKE